MKAFVYQDFGPIVSGRLAEIVPPRPASGQVLIEVAAVGLNFFDTLMVQGKYQVKPALPVSPGGELSGRIVEIGQDVEGLAVGDAVYAYLGHGAARQFVLADAAYVIKVPSGLDLTRAAAMGITYGTSDHALTARAGLKAGETLAVLGASGGVGLAAVELGKLAGARVIACASTDEKLAIAKDHGADELINYRTSDIKAELKRLTEGQGVDVIYDPVGGDLADPAIRSLGWAGRYLVVGFAAGSIPKVALNLPLLKGAALVGVFWGSWIGRDAAGFRDQVGRIADWCAAGKLRLLVHGTYPMADATKALEELERGKAIGKIVLTT